MKPVENPRIEQIELKYVTSLIPTFLHSKFARLKLKTIGDVLDLKPDQFWQYKGIGPRALAILESFQKEILDNPAAIVIEYQTTYGLFGNFIPAPETLRPPVDAPVLEKIPASAARSESLFALLRKFDRAYVKLNENRHSKYSRSYDIIRRTNGVDGKRVTMADLCPSYGVSRERIRQIRNMGNQYLKDYFAGRRIQQTDAQCHTELIVKVQNLRSMLAGRAVVSLAQVFEVAAVAPDTRDKAALMPYCDLIMGVYGYERGTFYGNVMYYETNVFTAQWVTDLCSIVMKILRKSFSPLDERALIQKVKKYLGETTFGNRVIQSVICALPQIIRNEKDGTWLCTPRFDCHSAAGMCNIVLCDAGKELHFEEITHEINVRLAQFGDTRCKSSNGVLVQLRTNNHFVPQGSTGYWGLRSWSISPGRIKPMIEQILSVAGLPMYVADIVDVIHLNRPDVKKSAVLMTVTSYPESFIRLKDGRIVLNEWGV